MSTPSIALSSFKIVAQSASFVNIDKAKAILAEDGNSCMLYIKDVVIKAEFKKISEEGEVDDTGPGIFKYASLTCFPCDDGSIDIECMLSLNDVDEHVDSKSSFPAELTPLMEQPKFGKPQESPGTVVPKTLAQILHRTLKPVLTLVPIAVEKPVLVIPLRATGLCLADSPPAITARVNESEVYRAAIQELKHEIQKEEVLQTDSPESIRLNYEIFRERQDALATLRAIISSAENLDVLRPDTPNHSRRSTMQSDLIEQIGGFLKELTSPEHVWDNTKKANCETALLIMDGRLKERLEEFSEPNGMPRRYSEEKDGPASMDVTKTLYDTLEEGGYERRSTASLDRLNRHELYRSLSSDPGVPDLTKVELFGKHFEMNYKRHCASANEIYKNMVDKWHLADGPLIASKDVSYGNLHSSYNELEDFITTWERASPTQKAEIGTRTESEITHDIAYLKSMAIKVRKYMADTRSYRKKTTTDRAVLAPKKMVQHTPIMHMSISAK